MKFFLQVSCFLILLALSGKSFAAEIMLNQSSAVVWLAEQTISGKLSGFHAKRLIVHHNQSEFVIEAGDSLYFSFTVMLHDTENKIWVSAPGEDSIISSVILYLTLGYRPFPPVKPYASVAFNQVTLHAGIDDKTDKKPLRFLWTAGSRNPATCKVTAEKDSTANAVIPLKDGIYYFNLLVIAGRDSASFQTYVTRKGRKLTAFDMTKEHAPWIDSAVVYEITPAHFVSNPTYDDITEKLPELRELGINTIWLQPVFKTARGGQGYDITDYFSLRTDLGDEAGLRRLITAAKSLNIRVLFDFVINHTAISHPYAQDLITNGKASHYYHFYQHENDGAKYSSHYKKDKYGFIAYFWDNLVNLDYNNPEVQQWVIEACKYWIRNFDIDGYRFDAVWAVNARAPMFGIRLRDELKSIKPDLFLLAEDKGSTDDCYRSGFDAGYDWTADTSWISQWSWQHEYSGDNNSIFKFHDAKQRGRLLYSALFDNGSTSRLRLRFIENNDLPRFIKSHSLDQVKMASALVFALPGIPLIYNGQETGFKGHPYTRKPIFLANQSIQSLDSNGLFGYYRQLIRLRQRYPALRDTLIGKLPVQGDSTVVAFHRWKNKEHFIIIMNLDSPAKKASVDLNELKTALGGDKRYFLKDLLGGGSYAVSRNNTRISIPMNGYGVRWLLLGND